MSASRDSCADLREAVLARRAVVVAGTGVALAATKGCPEASWAGLLKHGLRRLCGHDPVFEQRANAHLCLMDDEGAGTHHFLAAAQDVVQQLGGPKSVHFEKWLADTVGSLVVKDRAVLDAVDALRAHGNLLATTNYDSLLLGDESTLAPVTWQEYDRFLEVVRQKKNDKVLYLHGYWRKAPSVVLDWTSYERIARDESYRADLATFWQSSTWVYVGCGLNGLRDPDLGLLLDRYAGRLRSAGLWDYCLVQRSELAAFQAHFDAHHANIVAVSFGETREDLPAFLRSLLDVPTTTLAARPAVVGAAPAVPPSPPELYAVPRYVGTHEFVGRESQLRDLDDWARAADPTNLLLFEAIGGSGKSIMTWKWVTDRAPVVRPDWAGRFWYSFYERGAVMAHFCRHALAYMTEQPVGAFERTPTSELARALIDQLQERPWLVVLDGLERVLVAYHRIDAAELLDEALDQPTDAILDRGPTTTIREEDGNLLRLLAGARPSKILVTSRLTPRILLNPAGQPIPGVKRQPLGGLRPHDAEAMFRASGARGDSERIQRYLTENCDNHPLVVGVLAGLVVNYLPRRGDFDVWVDDHGPGGGGRLNLGELDLVQRRNHILRAAIEDLPDASRELLSTLALLPEGIDYDTLTALNPFLPPQPDEVPEPVPPPDTSQRQVSAGMWEFMQASYEKKLARRRSYEREIAAWRQSPAVQEAPRRLAAGVLDLEQRGLLQYDHVARHHDLHPVVRAVVAERIDPDDLQRHGQRLVDHFTTTPHTPYREVTTLDDVAPGVNLVKTLLKIGRPQQAAVAYVESGLDEAINFNLEAHVECVALLRQFFPGGWGEPVENMGGLTSVLSNTAGNALQGMGAYDAATQAYGAALSVSLEQRKWAAVAIELRNITETIKLSRPARAFQVLALALDLAPLLSLRAHRFKGNLWLFDLQNLVGWTDEAATTWRRLDGMGRDWPRFIYRPGEAELTLAYGKFFQGILTEKDLATAERLAIDGRSRWVLRMTHQLRGLWRLERGEWQDAAESLRDAVRMARERRIADAVAEAALALANLNDGVLTPEGAREEALRLSALSARSAHRYLAHIWHALGDTDSAAAEALTAYREAWADGEPYVFRYELVKTSELLNAIGVPLPVLPPYDADADVPFPWEAQVRAAIDEWRAELAVEATPEGDSPAG